MLPFNCAILEAKGVRGKRHDADHFPLRLPPGCSGAVTLKEPEAVEGDTVELLIQPFPEQQLGQECEVLRIERQYVRYQHGTISYHF